MCSQLTILAQRSPYCYVACCSHGTIHLRWEHVTVHLDLVDFLVLVEVIGQAYSDRANEGGPLWLGIGNLMLELRPDDYHPLVALVRQAAVQLKGAMRPAPAGSHPLPPTSLRHLN